MCHFLPSCPDPINREYQTLHATSLLSPRSTFTSFRPIPSNRSFENSCADGVQWIIRFLPAYRRYAVGLFFWPIIPVLNEKQHSEQRRPRRGPRFVAAGHPAFLRPRWGRTFPVSPPATNLQPLPGLPIRASSSTKGFTRGY